jgi:hypothetical protein
MFSKEKFFDELRKESEAVLAIANRFDNYKSLRDVPTDKLKIAADEYRRSR